MVLMAIHRPASPLRRGDSVACVAASSALADEQTLNQGIAELESWGLQVLPQTLASRRWGYLAGRDRDRSLDLQPDHPAALLACARGGWGAARLLEHSIRWQSGWILGFSAVTALLWARLPAEPDWSRERLRRLLFGESVPDLQGSGAGGGRCQGPLVVANLTVASDWLCTPHVPDLNGAILVLEDVGEAPYRIDRMLTQWRLAGILQRLAGIGFGNFEGCDDEQVSTLGFSLQEVLEERTGDLGIPRVLNLPVGHRSGNAALPMGALACLDGDQGTLSLLP